MNAPDLSREPFKKSPRSICAGCSNFLSYCTNVTRKVATDTKMGIAFITHCTRLNLPLLKDEELIKPKAIVTVDAPRDTRIESMGGGHKEKQVELRDVLRELEK